MMMGVMAGVNQEIDFEIAEKLGEKFNAMIVKKEVDVLEEAVEQCTLKRMKRGRNCKRPQ